MFRSPFVYCLILCYITSEFVEVNCVSNVLQQIVNIDLSSYNRTNKPSHVVVRYLNLAEGNAVLNVQNVPNNQGFFVVQAHSFLVNVSLSKGPTLERPTSTSGTNVGLVEKDVVAGKTYQYYVQNGAQPSFRVLLAVVMYEKIDPIPGGCNMVFNTEIASYQLVTYNDNLIRVDAQPASAYNHICDKNPTHLHMYHMHLYERNLDGNAYFDAIESLLTVDGIRAIAKRVPEPIGHSPVRRYYSAYPGTGSAYAIIATYQNVASAYVPTVTYACDTNNWDESCYGPVTVGWKILCAIILFMGLFTCYFGHRFFKTQMFIFGFVFGGFISYISASIADTLSVGESLGISLVFGCIYGGMWMVFWWRFGSPVLSVLLPVAFIGYITSCIVFYTDVGDIQIFQSDLNYWGIFFSILIPITAFLLIATMLANILACSVVGASAVTIAVDHYVGGNLHYIIVNNVRRASVSNFNLAVIDPPFQYRDIIMSLIWGFLVVTGVYAQLRQQRGKPPFPPPRSAFFAILTSLRRDPERTPLLAEETNPPLYAYNA